MVFWETTIYTIQAGGIGERMCLLDQLTIGFQLPVIHGIF